MSFDSIFLPLVGGKLKLVCIGSVAVLATTAAAIASSVNVPGDMSASWESVKNEFNKVPNYLTGLVNDASPKLKEQYESESKRVSDGFEQIKKNLSSEWESNSKAVTEAATYVKDNGKDINYYLFALGNVVKPLIGYTRVIIRDSIVHSEETKKNQQLLSAQKIHKVIHMTQFKTFVQKMNDLIKKQEKLIEGMSYEDGLGIIKIFREVREDDFTEFMKKVEDNIQKIESNSKTYTNSTELLKDVFIGVDELKNIGSKKESLCGKIDSVDKILDEDTKAKIKEILQKLEAFKATARGLR